MMKMQKILVVDDSEMNRSILADMLEDEYEIIEARNGIEAITAIKKQEDEICLVLLDIIMPEMDGFEVLTVMNRGGWIENIPVIMISAEVSSTYVDHAYDLGAVDYINRPGRTAQGQEYDHAVRQAEDAARHDHGTGL